MTQKPRTIHAGDSQDERLAQLPLPAAYTYAYLPTVLDDEGRAKDLPAVFNGYLWPLRADVHPTAAMAADIDALVEAGVLCRYEVGGELYLHDPRWRARQKVSRPVASTLPACATHDRTFDDMISETLNKVSDHVNSFLGGAKAGIDETKIRDSVVRIVEDVTFLVDPEKAASYGQKVRGLFAKANRSGGGSAAGRPSEPPAPADESAAPPAASTGDAPAPRAETGAETAGETGGEAGTNGTGDWGDATATPPPA